MRESEWRAAMVRLRDAIIYCGHCGSENFYDVEQLQASGSLNPCWSCQQQAPPPPRMRIERSIIMLNYDTQLFPHHIDPHRLYDFSTPVASVNQHPQNPHIWGIKNLSSEKWVMTTSDGSVQEVEPQRNVTMATGTKINFGKVEGEIRL